MERLQLLEESDLDIILASIPTGTRRLFKRKWLDTRPSGGRVSSWWRRWWT